MEELLLYHVYRQKQQPQIRVYLNDRQGNRLHILCDDGYDRWIGAEGFRQYYELAKEVKDDLVYSRSSLTTSAI